ncbi:MAG: hypothetical protein JOZ81_18630 [Chloroflexi bacterium]|nr:hypothetical protein [Chloroflexota bacterium]MBV9545634.1 hypothetical protein [Chloroflexota bacterium]
MPSSDFEHAAERKAIVDSAEFLVRLGVLSRSKLADRIGGSKPFPPGALEQVRERLTTFA